MEDLITFAVSVLVYIVVIIGGGPACALVHYITGEKVDVFNIQEDDDDATKIMKTENNLRRVSSAYKEFLDQMNGKK